MKSHAVVYVIIRDTKYRGQTVVFSQLTRVLASTLFHRGKPHARTNLNEIGTAQDLVDTFLTSNSDKHSEWLTIPLYVSPCETPPPRKRRKVKLVMASPPRDNMTQKQVVGCDETTCVHVCVYYLCLLTSHITRWRHSLTRDLPGLFPNLLKNLREMARNGSEK